MTMLRNFLPDGRVELIFLNSEDVIINIYEIDYMELEKILSEVA
jgi:hypothetical protein